MSVDLDDKDALMASVLTMFSSEAFFQAIVEFMNDHMSPGDVFEADKLDEWARLAGYERISNETA